MSPPTPTSEDRAEWTQQDCDAYLAWMAFRCVLSHLIATHEGSKDEILLEIKTNYWNMFNRYSEERSIEEWAADIFEQPFKRELTERLRIADYTYKDDEDTEEFLNVWAYHEAKRKLNCN